MRAVLNKAVLYILVMQLAACSYLTGEDGIFRDRKKDYRKEESLPRMEIPEGMDDSAIVDLYPVPPLSPFNDGEITDDFPLPSGVADHKKAVMIQTMGEAQWILLQASPSQVWPRLKEYLSAQGLQVTIENGAAGMIEARAAEGIYRYRIEQGFRRNSAELSVRYLASAAGAPAFWPDQSSDIAREKTMIDGLSRFFAEVSDKPAYSFAAQGISTQKKIAIEHDNDGHKVLVLLVGEKRAWLTIRQSLQNADFTLEREDVASGSFYTQYTPRLSPDDEPGFFSKLFGIKPDPYDEDVRYAGEHYRFYVSSDGDRTRLAVQALDVEGQEPVDVRKEQNHILLLLKEHLF